MNSTPPITADRHGKGEKMLKKLIAMLTLCALLAGCAGAAPAQSGAGFGQSAAALGSAAASGTGGVVDVDPDSLPEHPRFDYFTVCYYGTMESRVFDGDSETDLFLENELYYLTHRGRGMGVTGEQTPNMGWSWSHSDSDWALLEKIERLQADLPIFKQALEAPAPTEDLQRERVENETPWVKYVWTVNAVVYANGAIGGLDRALSKGPDDTIKDIRMIAVFLESPDSEGRLDSIVFAQDPETGEYLFWDAWVEPELGIWLRDEIEMYAWHRVL